MGNCCEKYCRGTPYSKQVSSGSSIRLHDNPAFEPDERQAIEEKLTSSPDNVSRPTIQKNGWTQTENIDGIQLQEKNHQVVLLTDKWIGGNRNIMHFNLSTALNIRRVDPYGHTIKIICLVQCEHSEIPTKDKDDAAKLGVELYGYKLPLGQKEEDVHAKCINFAVSVYYEHLKEVLSQQVVIIGQYPYTDSAAANLKKYLNPAASVILVCHDVLKAQIHNSILKETSAVFSVGPFLKDANNRLLTKCKHQDGFRGHYELRPTCPQEYFYSETELSGDETNSKLFSFCDKDEFDQIDDLLKAYDNLKYHHMPDGEARMWDLVCKTHDETQELKEKLDNHVRENIRRNVKIDSLSGAGSKFSDDMMDYFESATLTVIPPRKEDQLFSGLEALYSIGAGIPIIMEKDGNLSRILEGLHKEAHMFFVHTDEASTRDVAWKLQMELVSDRFGTYHRICQELKLEMLLDEKSAESNFRFLHTIFSLLGLEMKVVHPTVSATNTADQENPLDIQTELIQQLTAIFYNKDHFADPRLSQFLQKAGINVNEKLAAWRTIAIFEEGTSTPPFGVERGKVYYLNESGLESKATPAHQEMISQFMDKTGIRQKFEGHEININIMEQETPEVLLDFACLHQLGGVTIMHAGLNNSWQLKVEKGFSRLKLQVQLKGTSTITCRHDNIQLELKPDEASRHYVMLEEVDTCHGGDYVFTAINDVDQVSCLVSLLVLEKPVLECAGSMNITTTEGSRVELAVQFSGVPRPAVTWRKDNMDTLPVQWTDSSSVLLVPRCTLQHMGTYFVTAENECGQCNLNMTMKVNESFVEMEQETVTVEEGNDAVLQCRVLPEDAVVEWYVRGVPVSRYPTRFTMTDSGGARTLTIRKCTIHDAGDVFARVGSKQCKTILHIKEHMFTKLLETATIAEGDKADFKCKVSPDHAEVIWFYRGQQVDGGSDCKAVSHEHEDDRILKFTNCCVQDSGKVSVQMFVNSSTLSEASLNVQVPDITKLLKDEHLFEENNATFECTVKPAGLPVTWTLNGDVLQTSQKCLIRHENDVRKLEILKCETSDGGTVSVYYTHNKQVCSTATLAVNEGQRSIKRKIEPRYQDVESENEDNVINETVDDNDNLITE